MTLGIEVDELAYAYAEAQRDTGPATFSDFILQHVDLRHERFRRLLISETILAGAPSVNDLLSDAPRLNHNLCQCCITLLSEAAEHTAVIVHWASGNSKFLKEYLPRDLKQIEFWSTEDPSLASQVSPVDDLSALATHYVRHIEDAGIVRPLLIGICSGGQLAFEIAHQLEGGGREILGLLAINTHCPGVQQFPVDWGAREIYAYRLAFLSLMLAATGVEPSIAHAAQFLERLDWIDRGWDRKGFYWHQLIWATALASMEAYKARPLDAPITIYHGGGPGTENVLPSWSRLGAASEVITEKQDSKSILASEPFRATVRNFM